MKVEKKARWLRLLCWHKFEIIGVDQTGEHDGFAIMFGNTIIRKRCQKCGHRRQKVGYLP